MALLLPDPLVQGDPESGCAPPRARLCLPEIWCFGQYCAIVVLLNILSADWRRHKAGTIV